MMIASCLITIVGLLILGLILTYCIKSIKSNNAYKKQLNETLQIEDGSTVAPDGLADSVDVAPDYWISTERVVHNSLCRWYERCEGAFWDGEDGTGHTDCGLCGGTRPIVRLWNLPEWKAIHGDNQEEEGQGES